jgi:DNA-directed RNA polymerase specialized sigma24 family protein
MEKPNESKYNPPELSRDAIERLAGGDYAYLEEFHDVHGGFVREIIRCTIYNRELAKDCYQDFLIRLPKKLKKFDPSKSGLRTWLRTVTYRFALATLAQPWYTKSGPLDNYIVWYTPYYWNDEAMMHYAVSGALWRGRNERSVQAVSMRYIEELTYSEIAEEFGLSSPGAARAMVAKGRQRLDYHIRMVDPLFKSWWRTRGG